MTSPLLTRYGHNAELARGLKWVDEFESQETVARNGGVETSAPVINNGATFDGTDDYITYDIGGDTFADAASISLVIEFEPDFATNENADRALLGTTGSDYLINKATNAANNVLSIVLGGTTIADIAEATYSPAWVQNGRNILVVSGTTGNTNAWLNGTQILTADATAWTPATQDVLVIGAAVGASNFFDGTINSVKIFNVVLTADEAADYYNRTTWRYREDTAFYLPMKGEQHDPTNLRTLDASGNGGHFTFGDGATATTYPTKLTGPGYSFDGGDYLASAAGVVPTTVTAISMICVIRDVADTTLHTIFSYGEADATPIAGVVLYNNVDNKFYFYGGGIALGTYAATSDAIAHPDGVHVIVGTADGTQTQIYVDGKAGTVASAPQAITVSAASLGVVGALPSLANKMTGEVLFASLIKQALTPTQVADVTMKLMGRLQHA